MQCFISNWFIIKVNICKIYFRIRFTHNFILFKITRRSNAFLVSNELWYTPTHANFFFLDDSRNFYFPQLQIFFRGRSVFNNAIFHSGTCKLCFFFYVYNIFPVHNTHLQHSFVKYIFQIIRRDAKMYVVDDVII